MAQKVERHGGDGSLVRGCGPLRVLPAIVVGRGDDHDSGYNGYCAVNDVAVGGGACAAIRKFKRQHMQLHI